jgi:hypothetical protein
MKKPRFGEGSLGAVAGAVTGAFGGLVAVVLPLAIMTRDIQALSAARTFGIIGWVICCPVGWLLGGQIGPRLEMSLGERKAGIIGGIVGGLVPVAGFVLLGWYLVTPR